MSKQRTLRHTRRLVLAGLAVASAQGWMVPATRAQISGASVASSSCTGMGASNADGFTGCAVTIVTDDGSTLTTRYAANVNADVGIFSTRDQSGSFTHEVSFNAAAAGGYRLDVATTLDGDLNRISDAAGCEGSADISAVIGASTPALANGSISIADPGSLASGTSTTSVAIAASSAGGQIFQVSNGSPQNHTLTFTWTASVRSNTCEAAVRLGENNGSTTGCTACQYPGSPARVAADDGLGVSVTFTSLCGNGSTDFEVSEQCDAGPANGTPGSCCTSTCQYRSAAGVCRAAAGECDAAETCTGTSPTCPADVPQPNDTPCTDTDMDPCTPGLCNAGACISSDMDGDGLGDLCDTCDWPVPALANGGFEIGTATHPPDCWGPQGFQPGSAVFTWDGTTAHSGTHSVKIEAPTANDVWWAQLVAVTPAHYYQLSGWIKTDTVAHSAESVDAGANLSQTEPVNFERSSPSFGTTDWTHARHHFYTGAATEVELAARLGFFSGTTTGTAWFDDLALVDCGTLDGDSDGVGNPCDNCVTDANPDQSNSDCDDPAFFGSGACALPNPTKPGCCAGDVCDPCPAQADDSSCDPSSTAQGIVGPLGDTIQAPDGSVVLAVPAGALSQTTSIAVTENGPAVVAQFANAAAASFIATPHDQQFAVPATITQRWNDRDDDGLVDGGTCVLGADDGESCDADTDCVSGVCTVHHSNLAEADLVLSRAAAFFGAAGFDTGPYKCAAHLSGACATAVADCADSPGTGQASVARCCDVVNNQWSFQTCSFSPFDVTTFAGVMLPGAGSPKSDCAAEWKPSDRAWAVNELQKTPIVKNLLLPVITCPNGDPCDEDGSATNSSCEFRVSICMVVDEARLEKAVQGVPQPTCPPPAYIPIDQQLRVVSWTLKSPLPDAKDVQAQTNALNLRSRVVALGVKLGGAGATVLTGKHSEQVLFDPDVTLINTVNGEPACTEPVPLVVAAGDSLTIKTQTITSIPAGERKGLKDSDKLTLTCQPAP